MFSDSFFAGCKSSSSQPEVQTHSVKSPLATLEEWKALEGVTEWPCPDPSEEEDALNPGSLLGSQDEIERYMERSAPLKEEYLESVDKRLQEIEKKMDTLSSLFLWGPIGGDEERDPVFLTELQEHISFHRRRRSISSAMETYMEQRTLETLEYPGTSVECSAVPLPDPLDPHELVNLVTKTITIPPRIRKEWQKVLYSDSFCYLVQNTFWYVWLNYFKSKPEKEDTSKLFSVISENYMCLQQSLSGQKYKDKVFLLLPECLAKAVYSAFCHTCPKSSRIFNSDDFLVYVTDLTSQWITGGASPLGSWKQWPRHILDPHFKPESEDDSSPTKKPSPTKDQPLTENDVMTLSIKNKPRSVRLSGHSTVLQRRKKSKSSKSKPKTPTINVDTIEAVGVGEGPTFESVPFELRGRSPLLQTYLVTRGLEERGEMQRVLGPVIGRTRVSHLPPPSMTYHELLRCSREESKKNYDQFEKMLEQSEQDINSARKKHNALLRASERRTERLLQHKYKVTVLAEGIMNKYKQEQQHQL